MTSTRKRVWKIAKVFLGVAIIAFVGWRFVQDLGQLDLENLAFRPLWILISALLYVVGQSFSGWYWFRLLHLFGEKPKIVPTLRAYYLSQLGKYIPGKALALVLRGIVLHPEVKFSVAIITAFYEVLTTMAAGALVAALLFALNPPGSLKMDWNPLWIGLGLFSLVLIPICPPLFNRFVAIMTRRFQNIQPVELTPVRMPHLVQGLLATSLGWSFLGLSLWALLQGILPEGQPWTWQLWAGYTAMVSLSYVAGFLALVVPSGVGVREYFLLQLLPIEIAGFTSQSPESVAAMAILMLRLVWTATEVLVAGALFFFRKTKSVSLPDLVEKAADSELNPNAMSTGNHPHSHSVRDSAREDVT